MSPVGWAGRRCPSRCPVDWLGRRHPSSCRPGEKDGDVEEGHDLLVAGLGGATVVGGAGGVDREGSSERGQRRRSRRSDSGRKKEDKGGRIQVSMNRAAPRCDLGRCMPSMPLKRRAVEAVIQRRGEEALEKEV